MKCPKCQFENPENSMFCGDCGSSLEIEVICPNCGSKPPTGFRFCNKCGHDLTKPEVAPPKGVSFEEKLTKIQRYLPKGLTEKILSQKDRIDSQGFIRMIISIAMCIGYLLVMQVIGFTMSTCVFLFILMFFLHHKGWINRTIVCIAVSLIVWVIFRYLLVIPIPTGMLSFTF